MRVTIYLAEKGSDRFRLNDETSRRKNNPRSACIPSIGEEQLEKGRRLGEILIDLGVLSEADPAHALAHRKRTFADKVLEDALVEEQGVGKEAVERTPTIRADSSRHRRERSIKANHPRGWDAKRHVPVGMVGLPETQSFR